MWSKKRSPPRDVTWVGAVYLVQSMLRSAAGCRPNSEHTLDPSRPRSLQSNADRIVHHRGEGIGENRVVQARLEGLHTFAR